MIFLQLSISLLKSKSYSLCGRVIVRTKETFGVHPLGFHSQRNKGSNRWNYLPTVKTWTPTILSLDPLDYTTPSSLNSSKLYARGCLSLVNESFRIQPGSRNLSSLGILNRVNLIRELVTQITKGLRSKTDEATQGLVTTESCYHPWTERTQGGGNVPRTISEATWQEL